MNWTIFWIIIYTALVIFFVFKHMKKSSFESYIINDRKTKLIPLVFTSLATFVGGGVSIGLITMGYEAGFAAVAVGLAYVAGFMLLSRFAPSINRYCRENNIYSFTGFLNHKYLDNAPENFKRNFSTTINVINIFVFFFLLAVQFVGMASILEHRTGLDYEIALVLSCLLIVFYTTVAGLAGVIATDVIQFITMLIVIAVIFIPNLITDVPIAKLSELPTNYLNGTAYGLIFLIGLPLFILPSVSVKLDIWQRIIAAKNEATAKKAIIWSGFGMLFFYLIFPLVGMAVKLYHPDISSNMATFVFIESHTNSFLYGFAIIGLIAALMSSGDSFLNLISISFVKDFVGYKRNANQSEKMQLYRIRLASIIFGCLAIIVALFFPKIVDLMVLSTSAVVIFVPATFYALFVKKVSNFKKAALISIQLGFITNIVFFIVGVISPKIIEAKSSFVPAFIVSLITFFIAKSLTKKTNVI